MTPAQISARMTEAMDLLASGAAAFGAAVTTDEVAAAGLTLRTARATAAEALDALDALDLSAGLLDPRQTLQVWSWERETRRDALQVAEVTGRALEAVEAILGGGRAGRVHTVVSGQTFQSIAQAELGSWERWQELADLNGLSPAATLTAGQTLKLPGEDEVALERYDIGLPWPGQTTFDVTPSGDLPRVTSTEALERWVARCLLTRPDELLHRPGWGGGVQRWLGRPLAAAAVQAQSAAKRALERDRRIRRVSVEVQAGSPAGRLQISTQIETVDDTAVTSTLLL